MRGNLKNQIGLLLPSLADRRKYNRFSCNLQIYDSSCDKRAGSAVDMSLGGMCLESEEMLKPGDRFRFFVDAPHSGILLSGEVVRICGGGPERHRYGIKFSHMDDTSQRLLTAHLLKQHNLSGEKSDSRRKHKRVPCRLFACDPADGGNGFGKDKVTDVSLGGLCIESERDFELGRIYPLLLNIFPKRLFVDGKILNKTGGKISTQRYGVKFESLSDEIASTIGSFILEQQLYLMTKSSVLGEDLAQTAYSDASRDERWMEMSKILKSAEECFVDPSRDISWMKDIEIDKAIVDLHDRYSSVGHRNASLWKWAYSASHLTTLSTVPDFENVCTTKVAAIMLNVLLDDLADKHHAREPFELACKLMMSGDPSVLNAATNEWRPYCEVVGDVWNFIMARVKEYPNYSLLKDILIFDVEQLINCMRYSFISNSICGFSNLAEYYMYQSQNMNMMINLTIDLMNHEQFDLSELGRIREIVLEAQKLVRIGNMMSTWEREFDESDYSSGVFAYLTEKSLLPQDAFEKLDISEIKEIVKEADCEKVFLKEWLSTYASIIKKFYEFDIQSVDLTAIVANMPRLLISMHLKSRGYI